MLKKILVFYEASVSSKNKFALRAFLILDQKKFDAFSNSSQNNLKENISACYKGTLSIDR